MTKPDAMIYTIRPDGTSLWLPDWLATRMGVRKRATLTEAQFNHPSIQSLIEDRQRREQGEPHTFMTTKPQPKEVRLA